jgi:GntR family transcriptional regulator/MocR family aminotransferase
MAYYILSLVISKVPENTKLMVSVRLGGSMEFITPFLKTDSKIPIYQQLYTFLKEEIQSGSIAFGEKLPSKRKLASYLGISQNTIQSAYDQLIEEGYVQAKEKSGFFVCQLDHLQHLMIAPVKETTPVSGQQAAAYDYSYHGVDIPTFPFAIWRRLTKEVINEYDTELLIPGDCLGDNGLRQAIASYLHHSRGVNCTAQQVVISSGTEMLFQSLIQLFGKDCVYGIENPGYEKLNQLFSSNRANFYAIPIDDYGMKPECIQKSNANILCITPAHQFPSGQIMPINRRIQLLNWANQVQGRYLIEDDYDSEFKYSGKPIPALQGLDVNEKVIYMGSLSKSLSPTLRVSYMVLPNHLMERYLDNLSYLLCPVPIFEQKTLRRFIEEGYFERHLNKMRNIYRRKRELLTDTLIKSGYPITVLGADAGLHVMVTVDNQMTEEQLITSALRQGVKVYGSSKYYYDKAFLPKQPAIILGYAVISEEDIRASIPGLLKAWFPG